MPRIMYSWEFGQSSPGLGIVPRATEAVSGLEWPGNEASNVQRVLTFNGGFTGPGGDGGSATPFAFVDTAAGGATYIFKCRPKGPKNGGASFPNYWTLFFWGSWLAAFDAAKNFVGCHPYPFDGNTQATAQNWEISTNLDDYCEADGDANKDCAVGVWGAGGPPSETNGSAEVAWDNWYTVVVRVFRVDANTVRHQFIFNWDLFLSSSGASGWFQRTVSSATWGTVGNNPTTPAIVIGEAPPNAANDASWGEYPGREQWKGIVRGIQIYDKCLGAQVHVPSVANLSEIASELANPGSVRAPWYLCLNPTPDNVQSTSSSNHPWFPSGVKPALWTP